MGRAGNIGDQSGSALGRKLLRRFDGSDCRRVATAPGQ
jgi:hypothetical protein